MLDVQVVEEEKCGREVGLTSESEPFTISTNCLHLSINNKLRLCSKSPGYNLLVVSIASPILPASTNLRIPKILQNKN